MQQMLPGTSMVTFDLIDLGDANALLQLWEHKMGPCKRPNGDAWCHGLMHEGSPVALTVTAALIAESVGGGHNLQLGRENTIELARLCAARSGLCRVALRLWREFVFPSLGYRYAISYQDADEHNGDTYRFDGWKRLPEMSCSGTDKAQRPQGKAQVGMDLGSTLTVFQERDGRIEMSGEAKTETAECRCQKCGDDLYLHKGRLKHGSTGAVKRLWNGVWHEAEPSPVAPGEYERPEPQGQISAATFEKLVDILLRDYGAEEAARYLDLINRTESALTSCREERDRAQAALREAREFIENQQLPSGEWSRVLDIIVAALKPVSDRQPEGEKP